MSMRVIAYTDLPATETPSEAVARRLKASLEERGLNASQLAKLLGVRQQWLSRRLTGSVEFTIQELDDISRALGLPFVWIVAGGREILLDPPVFVPASRIAGRRVLTRSRTL
jgi:transcriptional regulator with XRE-family HTH domain